MPDKKRLLVLASTYPRWHDDVEPGFVHELSRRLIDDFDVTVLCPHAKGAQKSEIMDGVNIRRYRYAPDDLETLVNNGGINGNLKKSPWKWLLVPGFLCSQLWCTLTLVRKMKPDVIHAHWIFPQGLIAVLTSIFSRELTIVITSHGSDFYMLQSTAWKPIRILVASRAQVITIVGKSMFDPANKQYPGVDIRLMPMGIDFERFSDFNNGWSRVKGRLLYVGRLIESKGLGFLIEATSKVKKEMPGVQLQIVGDGPCMEKFQKQANDLQLSDSILFEGSKANSELPEYYQKCDLFIAPFLKGNNGSQEGLGLVLIEALGSGCRVLSGKIDAAEDLGIENVDVRDVNKFSEKIINCLSINHDSDDFENSAIRNKAEECYSWNVVSSGYRDLFNDLIRCSKSL
jgi:glycosyltransferase involved in cell wall biosynthesis